MRLISQLGAMMSVFACMAYAHPISEAAATGSAPASVAFTDTGWSFEPGVVIPLVLAAALFIAGALRRRTRPGWSTLEASSFIAGWLLLIAALVSPIHKLSASLFSVHMSQHELLMIGAAPLLVLSRPLLWFLWALPQGWREALGGFAKHPGVERMWSAATTPLFAWLLHGATLWLWHIPSLYEACLEKEWVHSLQHLSFLITALLFWWTLVNGRYGHLRYGIGVVYCFTTAVHTSVLGALMTFSRQLWYPIYDGRTEAFHLTPLEDQQLGGLIMWIPAGVIYIVLGLWLMAAWMRESEHRVQYTEAGSAEGDRHAQSPAK